MFKTYHPDVDRLAEVQAKIAELRVIEGQLKSSLTDYVPIGETSAIEGDLFRTTIQYVETDRVDWKAVALKLEPSRQLVTAHTTNRVTIRVARPSVKKGVAA